MSDDDDLEYEDDQIKGPNRRTGSYFVFDFGGPHERVPEMLELVATWLRACTEYQLEQVAITTDDLGWSTFAVTVQELRPGDLIEQLNQMGKNDLASTVAALVTEHGVREGLRLLGLSYQ